MYHLWRRTKKKAFKYHRLERFNKREERKRTHHDTTILSSLDFCYTFLHKRSYQAVVSAGEQLDSTFNRHKCMNSTLKKTQTASQALTFSLQLDNMLIMLRQTDCTERAGDQSSVRIDKQMWPLLYTWGWTGIFSPVNITCSRHRAHWHLSDHSFHYLKTISIVLLLINFTLFNLFSLLHWFHGFVSYYCLKYISIHSSTLCLFLSLLIYSLIQLLCSFLRFYSYIIHSLIFFYNNVFQVVWFDSYRQVVFFFRWLSISISIYFTEENVFISNEEHFLLYKLKLSPLELHEAVGLGQGGRDGVREGDMFQISFLTKRRDDLSWQNGAWAWAEHTDKWSLTRSEDFKIAVL